MSSSFREPNNLASAKCYEKKLEKQYATEYEFEIIRKHREVLNCEVWHWTEVPEFELFESGYIHDFNKHRLNRLARKSENQSNPYRDFGFDGLAKIKNSDDSFTYFGIQAKYYLSNKVCSSDIGTFLLKQARLTQNDPKSKGYLYSSAK